MLPAFTVAGALFLKRVEALFGEPEKLALGHLQVMRLNDGLIDLFGQQLEADFFSVRRLVGPDEAALAGDRLDDALALELRVRLGDGVPVDAQLFGERTD